jgi:hypothetical protein
VRARTQALRRTLLDKMAVAYAEVQRQPSSIFPEVKNRRLTGRRRAVSIRKKLRRENALLGYPPTKSLP